MKEYQKKTNNFKKVNLELNHNIYDFIKLQSQKENKTIKKIMNEIIEIGWKEYQKTSNGRK